MKNLKKVLSLALAFAMVLGLCVSGFAATDVTTLSDWDEVENKDAALLLNAFEIMQGDAEGFRPDDSLTRAEAAKMISVALWGGRDDSALYASGNAGNFTDLVYDWYKGYINYAAVNGIIAGDPTGTFRPDDTVTGYELLKMALTALGYDQEKAGLTGTGWDLRAMSLATKRTANKDLTDDTDVADWNAPITRTNAAQVIANMIYRNCVDYTSDGVLVENEEDNGIGIFGEAFLGLTVCKGTLIANGSGSTSDFDEDDDALDTDGDTNALVMITDTEKYGSLCGKKAVTLSNSTIEDLGKQVNVYFAGTTVMSAAVLDATEVTPSYSSTKTAYTNINTTTDDDGKATWEVEIVGSEISDDAGLKAAIDSTTTEVTAWDLDGDGDIDLIQAWALTPSTTIYSVADSETYGEVYMTNSAAWSESRYEASSSNIVKTGAIVESLRDFDAEAGDLVITCKTTNVFGQTFTHGYTLEAIEGTVTRHTGDYDTIYVDGVSYGGLQKTEENKTGYETFEYGAEGTFYIFNGSIVASNAAGIGASSTYAMVYDAGFETIGTETTIGGGTTTIISVNAILPDGTNKTFEVAAVYSKENKEYDECEIDELISKGKWASSDEGKTLGSIHNTSSGDGENLLIPYTLNDDGTINLYVCDAATAEISVEENSSITVSNGSAKVSSSYLLNSSSVTYYQTATPDENSSTETWVVYTGTSAPTYNIGSETKAYVVASDTDISYLGISSPETEGDTVTGVYVLMSDPDTVGSSTYAADVFSSDAGEVVELTWTGSAPSYGAGDIFTSFNSNGGFTEEVTPACTAKTEGDTTTGTTNVGYITRTSGNVITLTILTTKASTGDDGTTTKAATVSTVYATTSSTQYYFIGDGEGYALSSSDVTNQDTAAGVASNSTVGEYQALVIPSSDDDETASIVLVFEDVSTVDITSTAEETPAA